MQPAIIALVLAAAVPASQACSYTHEGNCVGVAKMSEAPGDGVYFMDGTVKELEKGAVYDGEAKSGMFMGGCSKVGEGQEAPKAGEFWGSPSQEKATSVAEGDKAPSKGVFCPSGADKCAALAKDAVAPSSAYTYTFVAPSSGVFVPDSLGTQVTKVPTYKWQAPETGFFCEGCVKVKKDAKAPSDGMYWSALSAAAVSVKKDDVAPGKGMFCAKGGVEATAGASPSPAASPSSNSSASPSSNSSADPSAAATTIAAKASADGAVQSTWYPAAFLGLLALARVL